MQDLQSVSIGREIQMSMNMELEDVELAPEKEKIEYVKEASTAFHCDLYNTEIVHKIAQAFLPGLATACVDNTIGGIFKSPASVAVDIRKEMIQYLTQRSESFVAESVILEGGQDAEVSDHPFDIISDFIDDFAISKRNFFSRISGWLLSENREDKIDDFVQEMELNGFWLMDRREQIAVTLLKNVDLKCLFHCDNKFSTSEELLEHEEQCGFRSLHCENDGCIVVSCANQKEKHDSVCPFKIIPCEQKCLDFILRREMDRHCITVCPMKLINCPFYAVGCQATVPQCKIGEHLEDDFHSHLLFVLKNIHKGASEEDLKPRMEQIVELSTSQLAEARDARSLTLKVKDLETKLEPLEIITPKKVSQDSAESANKVSEESKETASDVIEEPKEAASKGSEESLEDASKANEGPEETASNVSEESAKAASKAREVSTKAANQVSEDTLKATKETSETAGMDSDEFTGAASKTTEKSTEAMGKASEESTEAASKASEVFTEVPPNAREESIKSAGKASKEYTEELSKVREDSIEAARKTREESTEAASKVSEESTETSNLTVHASEEARLQPQS